MMKFLGFDVGGTKIEAAVLSFEEISQNPSKNESSQEVVSGNRFFNCVLPGFTQGQQQMPMRGQTLASARMPTERAKGYEHVLAQMVAAATQALEKANVKVSELKGIGVGLPGAVHPETQMMTNGNTLVLVGKPLGKDLAKALKFGGQVKLGNDANCFALAEHYCGAGLTVAKQQSLSPERVNGIGIILGTGCGGGFVFQGRVLEGANGGAAEVGHTILHPGGHSCYCGQNGCAEQYLSGTAIEAHYASRRYSQVQDVISSKQIFEQAGLQEPLAVAVVKQYKKDLVRFLAGLCNTLNPHYFVFGGGVSLQAEVYKGLGELVSEQAFLPGLNTAILQNELGDSAGVVGAALLSAV